MSESAEYRTTQICRSMTGSLASVTWAIVYAAILISEAITNLTPKEEQS